MSRKRSYLAKNKKGGLLGVFVHNSMVDAERSAQRKHTQRKKEIEQLNKQKEKEKEKEKIEAKKLKEKNVEEEKKRKQKTEEITKLLRKITQINESIPKIIWEDIIKSAIDKNMTVAAVERDILHDRKEYWQKLSIQKTVQMHDCYKFIFNNYRTDIINQLLKSDDYLSDLDNVMTKAKNKCIEYENSLDKKLAELE